MDIITAIISLITGGGLTMLITWRAMKAKALAEAKNANFEADNTAIDGLKDAISLLREGSERDAEKIEKYETQAETLREHINELRDECTTKGYHMCVHMGCVCRKPTAGRGKVYFKEHSKEDNYGVDYTPIEDLLSRYKRQQKNDTGADN